MDPCPLRLICIEPRFPGRLGAVADWLVRRRGYHCQFFCNRLDAQILWPESTSRGLEVSRYPVGGVAGTSAADWKRVLERGLCYAYGCWEALSTRRSAPADLILGRSAGLGSTLFTSLAQSGVPIVNLFDYYLAANQGDLANEDVAAMPAVYRFWRRSANAMDLLDLENGVIPWIPTNWQRNTFPTEYRSDFLVLFDGVDTRRFQRQGSRPRVLAGRSIPAETKIVSFVADTTDRRHGFDRFLELMNRLVRAGEDVVGVAIGAPVVTDWLETRYFNQDYRALALAQNAPPDKDRLLLLDQVSAAGVAELLALSDLHIYPNRSTPVSRSLLEAMAAGCVVLASDTEPVREIVTHGRTGFVVRAEDPEAWECQARALLRETDRRTVAEEGQRHVRKHYSQDVTLPKLAKQFDRWVSGASGSRR